MYVCVWFPHSKSRNKLITCLSEQELWNLGNRQVQPLENRAFGKCERTKAHSRITVTSEYTNKNLN